MKKFFTAFLAVCSLASQAQLVQKADDDTRTIYPGEPGKRPFWNINARRFIYAPSFDLPEVKGATNYLFTIKGPGEKTLTFTAAKPWAPLSPVWDKIAEGYTTLVVEGVDASGKTVGKAGDKEFYRSPAFSGMPGNAAVSYLEASRRGLKAIYDAPHVRYWLTKDKPDPTYARYCYPNKIIGGLMRAMTAYAKVAETKEDRDNALLIAKRNADYLLSLRYPADYRFAGIPPTYLGTDVNKPIKNALEPIEKNWFMVPSAIDPALGLLDLYDVTKDARYLNAVKGIANTLLKTQEKDGTWPYMANKITGASEAEQRLIPTWVIFFFDRLDKQYQLKDYRAAREKAWQWVVNNPLKSYQWDGQFEDIKPRAAYMNLAREQACDVAMLLLSDAKPSKENIAKADELLRFAEDQFVVWSPVTDPDAWRKVMPERRKRVELWITPAVLEQYACYDPVARSSAILINAYIRAHEVTNNALYLAKAKALANAMLEGQAYINSTYKGTGEIPTWNMKIPPSNWLNNSYYAAEAVLNLANYKAAM